MSQNAAADGMQVASYAGVQSVYADRQRDVDSSSFPWPGKMTTERAYILQGIYWISRILVDDAYSR